MDQEAPEFSLDTIKIYLQEEGPTTLNRIRSKVLGTAVVTAVGSTLWSTTTHRNVPRTALALTSNAAIAAAAFSVCQEGVRAVRHGQDDGWNSFAAGGLAGAALTRAAYGRGFHLLGAVLWAPLCGTLHWANSQLQIGPAVQAWLVKQDLLDLPHIQQQLLLQEQQEAARAAAALQEQQEQLQQMPKVPVRFEDMDWQEKVRAVNAVKQRELQALQEKWRQEEQEVLAQGLKQRQQQRQQEQQQRQQEQQQQQLEEGIPPQRKRWLLF